MMRSPNSVGRRVGLLLLVHLIVGLTTPYIILRPLNSPLTFAGNEVGNAFRVRLAVMLLFIGGAITVAIAVTIWPMVREYSYALALWLFALAIANFSLQCVENAAWMSLLTLSQNYASATVVQLDMYQLIGAAVRSYWKWVHYTHLLVMVVWMCLVSATFWRYGLVPRILAGLAVLTCLLQITGITLPQFLDYRAPMGLLMGLPLGFIYLALAAWLLAKGFRVAKTS
jgi:hypothetical protein